MAGCIPCSLLSLLRGEMGATMRAGILFLEISQLGCGFWKTVRLCFRCSACNFTADIKQSLTVHEMNHHVPPVGQAAGLGVGRRRNKVGASDTAGAEEAVQVIANWVL